MTRCMDSTDAAPPIDRDQKRRRGSLRGAGTLGLLVVLTVAVMTGESRGLNINPGFTLEWSTLDGGGGTSSGGAFGLSATIGQPDPGPSSGGTFTLAGGYWVGLAAPPLNPADLNGDGIVNGADLAIVLGNWGSSEPIGDINCDGTVNGADLAIVLGAWG